MCSGTHPLPSPPGVYPLHLVTAHAVGGAGRAGRVPALRLSVVAPRNVAEVRRGCEFDLRVRHFVLDARVAVARRSLRGPAGPALRGLVVARVHESGAGVVAGVRFVKPSIDKRHCCSCEKDDTKIDHGSG